jgi:hypothetical protein
LAKKTHIYLLFVLLMDLATKANFQTLSQPNSYHADFLKTLLLKLPRVVLFLLQLIFKCMW